MERALNSKTAELDIVVVNQVRNDEKSELPTDTAAIKQQMYWLEIELGSMVIQKCNRRLIAMSQSLSYKEAQREYFLLK